MATVQLKDFYKTKVIGEMTKKHDYNNVMQVPRLEKVVINMGLGKAKEDSKIIEKATKELAAIALQKPVVTKAKKAVSNFKIREGLAIGSMVTLRGDRMWIFLEKLINIALPRVRDFRGVPTNSFDGRGNYNLGIREQLVFPEITFDQMDGIRGMDIAIVTSAENDEEARSLLEFLGMPFRK
ncbi:MAG: 50S ribosomal protein L5 [Trueperaceae bacterium]